MKQLNQIKKAPLKKLLDSLWREIVIHNITKCEMCGEQVAKGLNAHHLISRAVLAYRWEISNVAVLCAGCHIFKINAAHVSPWILYENLELLLGVKRSKWFNAHKLKLDNPPPTLPELQRIYQNLNTEYVKAYGVPFRKTIKI